MGMATAFSPRLIQTRTFIARRDQIGKLKLMDAMKPGEKVAHVFEKGNEAYFALHQALATALKNDGSTVFDDVLGHVQCFNSMADMNAWVDKASALVDETAANATSLALATPEPRRIEILDNMVTISDVGKRPNNQDYSIIEKYLDADIAIGADGAGGKPAGDYASQRAAEFIHDHLVDNFIVFLTRNDAAIEDLIREAIVLANKTIWEEGLTIESKKGMGTTIDVMVRVGKEIYYGHAGDGRIYRIRKGQRIAQITKDDRITSLNQLTKAVGLDGSIDPTVGHFTLEEGERVLWCSDGLHPGKEEHAFRALMQQEAEKQQPEFAEAMVNAALQNPKSNDNATVIVLEDKIVLGENI
ncbi:MAG: PP2C family serine/threonine-protein phosphatase [Candidatus Margulisiibacteriota bacterium]